MFVYNIYKIVTYCDVLVNLLSAKNYSNDLIRMGLISQKSYKNYRHQSIEIHFLIYNYFIIPSNPIRVFLKKYKKMWEEYFIIGVHIRTNRKNWNEAAGPFQNQTGINNTIHELVKSTKEFNKTNTKWFIATDNEDILEYFKSNYPQYLLTVEGMPINHSKRSNTETDLGVYHSILDSYLLSYCDSLILTASSTFSTMAWHRSFLSIKGFLGNNTLICNKCGSVTITNKQISS